MPPTLAGHDLILPDPDAIRAAIDQADDRAKQLRRLLRAALRLRYPLTTADRLLPIRPASATADRPAPGGQR